MAATLLTELGAAGDAPPPDAAVAAALEACANSGALSALQLEGALRAARRHAVVANGVRAGFFLGDGAGQRANRIIFHGAQMA